VDAQLWTRTGGEENFVGVGDREKGTDGRILNWLRGRAIGDCGPRIFFCGGADVACGFRGKNIFLLWNRRW
jgi:hypothetical protein